MTELLRELVALTVEPPVDVEIEDLLAAFEAMYAARQAALSRVSGKFADTPENRALLEELAARDAQWEQAILLGREAVGEVRVRATKLRGYAR